MKTKEQLIKDIDDCLRKINELKKEAVRLEEPNVCDFWVPDRGQAFLFLTGHSETAENIYPDKCDKWVNGLAERGRIAPNTEEGRKTLEKRDEWFRFMFKFMTAGDVEANGCGHSFYVNIHNNIIDSYGDSASMLGHNKFSTKRKFDDFIKSFGNGDYGKGLEYIRKMLTGGLK